MYKFRREDLRLMFMFVFLSVMKFVGYEYRKEHKKTGEDPLDGSDDSLDNTSDID